jgi:transposase-like protein
MSRQQFTPEFKDEAVRQVTEKGHSVQEVAARLGVSSHSLYKWVKAVRPTFAFAVNGRRTLYDRDGCANPVRLHSPAISYT